jgi:hypothetical protein
MGTISGGGIAGVASKAKGSSIKRVEDQSDYSKWEFIYNPQKDAAAALQGALQNNGAQNPNAVTGGQQSNPGFAPGTPPGPLPGFGPNSTGNTGSSDNSSNNDSGNSGNTPFFSPNR